MRHFAIFKQYNWLIDTISRANGLSFREIQRRWALSSLSEGNPYPRSTFCRHREEILELFEIEIICRKAGDEYLYYIEESAGRAIPSWMVSTMRIQNMLEEFAQVKERILLENIPTEGSTLRAVVKAMSESRRLTITYQRYESTQPKTYTVEPLCVKQYNRRWYVVVRYPEFDRTAALSLDRIKALVPTDERFDLPPGFDPAEYFRDSFGVAKDDSIPAERVIVRAYDTEALSLRDLPLHPSQRLLMEADGYSDFDIRIAPTWDFFGYVLSRGGYLRVMEPRWVVDEIAELAECVLADARED